MKKTKKENPTYFMCGKKDIPELLDKAKKEAEHVLEEFKVYYRTAKPISIELFVKEYELCYSIGAKLLWDKEVVLEESDCSLLFLHLNHVVLNRIIQLRKEQV